MAEFSSSNLPIVVIDTHGQEIPYDNPRIVADMGIIYNGPGIRNNLSDPFNNYWGKISIEIRGSSSAGWSKKSYGLETQYDDGSNRNVSLLNLPEENDWVLYAPYYDRSLMRNVLAYKLAREQGWYASRTRFCELLLNGEYKGLYVLMEKIKRDKNRVAISKLKPDEISGDDLTGGYIIKIDKEPWKPGFDSFYPPYIGAWQTIRYQYHYPKPDIIAPEQMAYIQIFINNYETAMNGNEFAAKYEEYINVDSFVDYFLLNELSKNVDAYRLSAYFYKDKESKGGKLTAGPVWDFNFSFGNVAYYDAENPQGWELIYFTENQDFHRNDPWQVPFWWKKLVFEPKFASKLIDRWWELRNTIFSETRLYEYIDTVADTIAEAMERNFEVWIGPGDPPAPTDGWWPPDDPISNFDSYDDEIAYLKTWITARIQWIDTHIADLTAVEKPLSVNTPKYIHLMQNFPNPFNPRTSIRFILPRKQYIELKVYTITGGYIKTLASGIYSAGSHKIIFDATEFPSGVYIYSLNNSIFKKMLLIK